MGRYVGGMSLAKAAIESDTRVSFGLFSFFSFPFEKKKKKKNPYHIFLVDHILAAI